MKKGLIPVFILVLLTTFILAIPSIPNVFSGTIEYSGDKGMSLTGYDISASIENYGLGVLGIVGENNFYDVMVDPQGRTGEIHFYIGGVEAEETSIYSAGEFTDLDLTINNYPSNAMCGNEMQEPGEQCDVLDLGIGTCENVLGIIGATGDLSCTEYCTFDYSNCSAPYCGDTICNNGETCSTCPGDCGVCSSSSSSSGSGSSSSGSGSSSSGSGDNDETNNDNIINLNYPKEDNTDKDIDLNYNEEQETISSGITGGVIGFVKSGAGIGLIFAFIIIVLVIGVIAITKKKIT